MRLKRHCLLLLLILMLPASSFAKSAKVVRLHFLGLGPGTFSNMNSSGLATVFTGGYVWNMAPSFDLMTAIDVGISFKHLDLRYLLPSVKGRYMLDPEADHSWYAGGGFGIGYARNNEDSGHPGDSVVNVALSAAFGYKFYRKSMMPLSFEVEHTMFLEESRYGTPILTSLKMIVGFP